MDRVLVVDDEVPVARALERWLLRQGAAVCLVTNSAVFETALLRERPTLVISDFLMPGLDGIAVLRTARALAPEARRCLLSGSLGLVTEAQRASVAPCLFIDKPWDTARLASQLGLAKSAR